MSEEINSFTKFVNTIIEFCVNYSFQVLGALIILIVGFVIANSVSKFVLALFLKKNLDITLSKFIAGMIKMFILAFVVLIALSNFGVTIAPFVAALGAVAFGTSIALQGPLSNYGAGISIILGRPFVVGNTITVAGVSGVVKEVKLASTILTDEDGTHITLPNKDVVGQILHNSLEKKVVEAVIGVSYDDNPENAIRIIQETLKKFDQVTKEPAPQVGIGQFADSSINIAYRYWVPTVKYFQTSYAVNLAVYKALVAANIKIPYPQRDIHIVSSPTSSVTP